MQIMTIVRGKVPQSAAQAFEMSYSALRGAGEFPPGLMQSFFLKETVGHQDAQSERSYAIETIWESREALDKMRSSTDVPTAILVFKNVGVIPSVEFNEIVDSLP